MRFAAFLAAFLLTATTSAAESLGWGRLMTNDVFGDTRDRWRTGSYAISNVRGLGWTGVRPAQPFDIIELRFRGEAITPRSITTPLPIDRRFAGTLSFGAHTHFNRRGLEVSLGADLVFVGPQTRLDQFQESLHELLNQPLPSAAVHANQIENTVRLGFAGEVARPVLATSGALVRPFAELTTEPETIARIGVDVFFGGTGRTDLLIRDVTTGHLYRGTDTANAGQSFVLGADVAYVARSLYFPAGDPATLSDTRVRLRAGWHWQIAPEMSFFYGVTYLSEEFDEQPEGQFLGSLKLNFNF